MPSIESVIQSGAGNAWLLLPTAVLLGALHALEPGHSKSLMTAFIVAIHGTARQAVLLAFAATVGHTIVVWALALLAWRLGDSGLLETAEPWLLLAGGFLLIALAIRIWMRGGGNEPNDYSHSHDQGDHDHSHGVTLDDAGGDAHARAHEAEIKKRYSSGGPVSNGEVAWFGFTGGLLPCPAAFAVLLACLHQKAYALGLVMVAAFSLGLALTLVAVGVAAAWGAEAIRSRVSSFDALTKWAPYVSAAVVFMIGFAAVIRGAHALALV